MAERAIKPIHNVFKQYRKVNLVNPYLHSKPFESTWRTSNTSTGSSASNQIKLPLVSTGSYNFTVNWGDGTSDTITAWNQAQTTHTYSVAGDYTIKITGNCNGWRFVNTGDRQKILSVTSWGILKLGNLGNYFEGCTNLNLSSVTDILNLDGTTVLTRCFSLCSNLTSVNRISEWNLSSITSTNNMFLQCFVYNQNMGEINWVNNLDFTSMFNNASIFNNGGSSSINNWTLKTTGNVIMNSMFQGSNFNQPIGNWNTIAVGSTISMLSNCPFNQNISPWNVSNVTNFSSMFNSNVNFNNGLASGVAGNMLWNMSSATNLSSMFGAASSFNQNLGVLNLPVCTSFVSMFSSAIRFDNGGSSDINNWVLNTTTGISMLDMFRNATNFNQPLNSWNTSMVTNMSGMFARSISGTNLFNQNIGNWIVNRVVDFSTMFSATTGGVLSFNNGGSPDINNWILNTTNDVNTSAMFRNNKFNQPLNLWNTSRVTNMSFMFATSIFNQNIGSWDVSNVTATNSMFATSAFNQDISLWNTSKITNMSSMFSASAFNQNIGGWDVSKVTNMSSMFSSNPSFNRDISLWNVSLVTNMSSMFQNATAFNQNIGAWNISNVINFTNFMTGKTDLNYSASNLDAIYNGWSSLSGGVKPSIVISFATIKYTAAGSAGKAILQGSPNNWTITDGGI